MEKIAEELKQPTKASNIVELKEYMNGALIELPGFGKDQPFYARLRRPSMLSLMKAGKIPNDLLNSANTLFDSGVNSIASITRDQDALKKVFDVIELICEAAFVEPTYKDLREAGIELTDEQMLFVFGYAQVGVQQLNSFRK